MPFKRYEIGRVFRNGPVKLGRTREFYQCDVDCVGLSGPQIEAELVLLAVKAFKEIGIEPVIKIGNRKQLTRMIESVGVKAQDIEKIISIVDRIGKVDLVEVINELTKFGAQSLLQSRMEIAMEQEMAELFDILKEMDIDSYCEFSPFLARGLNIYTGTVWEIYDKAGRLSGALGAGGRYDDIIGNFIDNGQKYPAVGMSFGLEPISAILSMENKSDKTVNSGVDIMVVPMGTQTQSQLIAESWRNAGLRVLVSLTGKSVGKSFEYANAEGIPFVCVIGENETKSGRATIKRMNDGNQFVVKIDSTKDIVEYIKNG